MQDFKNIQQSLKMNTKINRQPLQGTGETLTCVNGLVAVFCNN